MVSCLGILELELLLTSVKLHVFALYVENLEKFRVRNEKKYFEENVVRKAEGNIGSETSSGFLQTHQSGVSRDIRGGAPGAIAHVGGEGEAPLAALPHAQHAPLPPCYHLGEAGQGEVRGEEVRTDTDTIFRNKGTQTKCSDLKGIPKLKINF